MAAISHVYLPVRDLDDSQRFYTETLGFKLLRRWSIDGNESAYLVLKDVLLELVVTPELELRPTGAGGQVELRIGLAVDDLDATLADLRISGVEVIREPWNAMTFWGRQAQIRDPSGYGISLRQWEPPDGPGFADWQPRHGSVSRVA